MTDEETRDYLEQHTLIGASARLERQARELWAVVKTTTPIRQYLALIEWTLRLLTRLISKLSQ